MNWQSDQKKMKKLFLKVTKDKYELPLAVADSQRELARMLGIHQSTIARSLIRAKKGSRTEFREVEIDDE